MVSEVHICLLSDQLLPNLIPILMERPDRVYLVATREMAERSRDTRMRRLLRRENIDTRIRRSAPSTGIDEIRRFAEKLVQQIIKEEAGKMLALNATGGTKLLSMGFVDVFRKHLEGYPLRVIYTDTHHQVIETLVPRGLAVTPMEGVLKAKSYLAAQGMELVSAISDAPAWKSAVSDSDRSELTRYLAEECKDLGSFLGMLNGLVHGTRQQSGALTPGGGTLINPEQQLNRRPWGRGREALTLAANAGLIQWDGAATVRFNTVDAARYLGGHWLEEYTWLVANAADLQDVCSSATVRWELQSGPTAPTNEFDLLAVHGNRLLLVECKTGRQGTGEQAVATRLESLARNAGGLFGSSLLVSAREFPTTMKIRCRSLGIMLLEQSAIKTLAEHVEQWRDTGVLPTL